MPLVYAELRAWPSSTFAASGPGHTLQPTAVVHEAYFRLVDQTRVTWKNRGHFFAVASQAMRRILIDHARGRGGGQAGRRRDAVTLQPASPRAGAVQELDLLALDEALMRLKALDAGRRRSSSCASSAASRSTRRPR